MTIPMDLKTLLLHSISSDRVLTSQKRVHLGAKCYSIAYEVNGKYLTVKGVRQVVPKLPIGERIMRRKRLWQRLLARQSDELPERLDAEMQTISPRYNSQGVLTEQPILVGREQQTMHKYTRKQGSQTVIEARSHGVQTEQRLHGRCTQTDWNTTSAGVQTCQERSSQLVQTDVEEQVASMQIEKEAVIFLLNEIGEMIINQNHLLHNNSTLLGQISEMMMLNKIATQQNDSIKHYERLERRHKARRHVRFCGNYPSICLCRRRQRFHALKSKTTQTEIQSAQTDVWTQTVHKKREGCWYIFSS